MQCVSTPDGHSPCELQPQSAGVPKLGGPLAAERGLGVSQRVGRLPNEGRRVLGAVVTGLSVMLGPTVGVSGR